MTGLEERAGITITETAYIIEKNFVFYTIDI